MDELLHSTNYTFVNSIFYKNKVLKNPKEVDCLEPFFYDSSIELNYDIIEPKETKETKETKPKETKPKETKPKETKPNEPKETKGNSIFWSIYIDVYGYDSYITIGSRYTNCEIEEKQKIISYLKSNQHLFKTTNNKITKAEIQEIYSEFMSIQSNTTLLGIVGLSLYYKAKILVVNKEKNLYYDIHADNYERTIVLIKNPRIHNKQVYGLGNIEDIDLDSMIKMESIKKALKAISNYKQSELQYIYETYIHNQSNNPIGHMKKPELYNKIIEHCGVFV